MKKFITEEIGITDLKHNPFARKSWIEQGFSLTAKRKNQLMPLFGKTVDNIKAIKPVNNGRYPAFVAIRWGYAEIRDGKLTPTKK